jgi:hypothetical protein
MAPVAEVEGKAPWLDCPQPQSFKDLGLPEIFLAHLILKHCFFLDVFTLGDLGERLKLPATVLTQILEYLRKEKWVEARSSDPLMPAASSLTLAHRHALTEGGKRRAAQLLEYDAYVGPTPVPLEDYRRQVRHQGIRQGEVTPSRVREAFQDLVVSPRLLEQLGPAAASGKPLFLYGPSGNGKTSIALRLTLVWDDTILVPYALWVEGHVIRVFDALTHGPRKGEEVREAPDRRWVRCRRPVVLAGGEVTLDLLDLAFNPTLKYYEAPLQLKANNGVFIMDDFGRQQASPQDLLNRWILPLETRQDFLCLHTGHKFAIPFDLFLILATNLEPRGLVDEAYFRRISYKVQVQPPSREEYLEIFRLVCRQHRLEFGPEAVNYLLSRYYEGQRPLAACHPRDLVEQILDYHRFHRVEPRLTPETLDRACAAYFV